MLRDASHQQVTQKFSFIESLHLSRKIESGDSQLHQIESDGSFNSVTKTSARTSATDSAIVNSSERNTTIDTSWYQSDRDDYSLSLTEIVKYTASDKTVEDRLTKPKNYLGKILFALTCSYSIFTLWWLGSDRLSQIITTLSGGKYITISKSDNEFINYMERSLSTIERQLDARSQSDSEDEVVYVPVYTPNAAPTLPSIPLPSSSVPANLQGETNAPAKQSLPTQALKIPAPPPLPEPTPIAPAESFQTPPKTVAKTSKPAIKHTLTGILELGAGKSAALIKTNGQTKQFWLGEEIGNSGWILESVSDRDVKISDREQTRSVTVGETF